MNYNLGKPRFTVALKRFDMLTFSKHEAMFWAALGCKVSTDRWDGQRFMPAK